MKSRSLTLKKILKTKKVLRKSVGKKLFVKCNHKDMWVYTYATNKGYGKEGMEFYGVKCVVVM